MPRSNGTMSLTAGNPVVTGATINSTVHNNTLNDVANEITNSIPRDGTAPPTANMPLGNFKLTGIGAATSAADVPQYAQVQSGVAQYLTSISGTNTITASLSTPTLTAYATGNTFIFIAQNANTGAVTININGIGAKSITKNGTTALVTGDILANAAYQLFYDGTQFQISIYVNAAAIQNQSATAFTTTGTSTAYVGAPSPAITALADRQSYSVKFNVTAGLNPTLAVSGTAGKALKQYNSAGALVACSSSNIIANMISDVQYSLVDNCYIVCEPLPASPVLNGYFNGGNFSTAGSSATFSQSSAQVADSTNSVMMALAAFSKTTSAWAVGSGNGGLDTGAIANNTLYYRYIIRHPDTGVTDLIFSLSSSLPTLPANYTQYRYAGGMLTNGSAQWTPYTEFNKESYWSNPPALDFNTNGSATAALLTFSTLPKGRKMKVFLHIIGDDGAAGAMAVYISDPDNADVAVPNPSINTSPLASFSLYGAASQKFGQQISCWTNTSGQIRHRATNTNIYAIQLLGWADAKDS